MGTGWNNPEKVRLPEKRTKSKEKTKKRKCVMEISLLHGQEKPFCQTFFLKWLQLH
jgi:hypothetical protein